MAHKRYIDRLPIIPADATEHNVVCHLCIVGSGYKAYTWDVNRQGGTAPGQNKFGVDLGEQQAPETEAWYSPAMYNIVEQNGKDVHLVIKPDVGSAVNSGLGSIRGARLAEQSCSRTTFSQMQRLTDPLVWRYGQMQPTSWDDALAMVAGSDDAGDPGAGRTACSCPRSTTAAPAAATRTPGAPASCTSRR